jgi:hypothetical protein
MYFMLSCGVMTRTEVICTVINRILGNIAAETSIALAIGRGRDE